MAAPVKSTPKDAQVMACILKDLAVTDYEPRVINQMLEFAYRYITDVLDDAKVYSSHANKKDIDKQDVKLAIQSKMDHTFTTPPPRELLMEIARQKNSQPLPLIKSYSGLKLPPDRYCLSAPNYKLRSLRKMVVKPTSRVTVGSSLSQLTHIAPRISFSNKSQSARLTGVESTPTVVTQPKPQSSTINTVSQTSVANIKPIVRINSGGSSNSSSSSMTESSGTTSAASSLNGTSLLTNPLKRKLDDTDDYDKE